MKQTAVEFLIEHLECRSLITKELKLEFVVAKEMEKKQIIDAYTDGRLSVISREIISYEQYYQEQYKK